MIDRMTGLSRQIGFVRFETAQQAQAVIDEMNGFRLSPGAPPLIIKFADTKEQKEARQSMRARARGGHHHGMHPGAGNSHIPPMYYYYPQYGAAFGYQGYPAFGANPAAAAAAAAAGYNANAYPYAAMAGALGYGAFPGAPAAAAGQPGQGALPADFTGLQPPAQNDKTPPEGSDPAFASQPRIQFTPNAANVSLSNIN